MNKPSINTLMRTAQIAIGEHGPQIITGMGIAGMIFAAAYAVKKTPEALRKIDKAKKKKAEVEQKNEVEVELTKVEVVKVTVGSYIPSVIIGAVSIGCIISGCSANAKRIAMLSAAYHMYENALTDYKDAALDVVGEKKEQAIRDKVAENKVDKNPVGETTVVVTGKGNSLCLDAFTGTYFRADYNAIKHAENELNRTLRLDDSVPLSFVYDMLGRKRDQACELLGWCNRGMVTEIELEVSAQVADNGEPCLVISYSEIPEYEYWKLDY